MKILKTITALFAALSMMFVMGVTQAATVTWDFNLPSTAVSSQNPPYQSVATLTLEDFGGYVLFTLDPNQLNSGFTSNSGVESIFKLNIAYQGADLFSSNYEAEMGSTVANVGTSGIFQNQSDTLDTVGDGFVAVSEPPNSALILDTGYKVTGDNAGQLLLDWGNDGFSVETINQWRIYNTTIADNFSLLATHNSHPSPTFGILSTSAISLGDTNRASSSNWVTGPSVVPVPAAAWLFGTALFGFFAASRRKKNS